MQKITFAIQLIIVGVCIWLLLIQPIFFYIMKNFGFPCFIKHFGFDLLAYFKQEISWRQLIMWILSTKADPAQKFKLANLVVAGFSPAIIKLSLDRTYFLNEGHQAKPLLAVHIGSAITAALFGLVIAAHSFALAATVGGKHFVVLIYSAFYIVVSVACMYSIYMERDGEAVDSLFRINYYRDFVVKKRLQEVCFANIRPFTIKNGLSKWRLTLGALSLLYFFINIPKP